MRWGSWGDTLSQVYQSVRQTQRPCQSRLLKSSPNNEVRWCVTDVLLTSKGYHSNALLSSLYFYSCRANSALSSAHEVNGVTFDRTYLGLGPVTQTHRHGTCSFFTPITRWACRAGVLQCHRNTRISSYCGSVKESPKKQLWRRCIQTAKYEMIDEVLWIFSHKMLWRLNASKQLVTPPLRKTIICQRWKTWNVSVCFCWRFWKEAYTYCLLSIWGPIAPPWDLGRRTRIWILFTLAPMTWLE